MYATFSDSRKKVSRKNHFFALYSVLYCQIKIETKAIPLICYK